MAGIGVLFILFGSVISWSGFNDLSALTVLRDTASGAALPPYTKGSGAEKALAVFIGFELAKAAANGLSSLLTAGGAAAAAKGAGGGGGGDESKPPEDVTPDEGIGDLGIDAIPASELTGINPLGAVV